MVMYTEEQLRQAYLQFLMGLYLVQNQVSLTVQFPDIETFRPIYEEVMEELS